MIRSGRICLDENKNKVFIRDERGITEATLDKTEFELLKHFVNNERKIFSRKSLLEKVWGYEFDGDIRIVDITVRKIREKIEKDIFNPRILLTKRGIGYYYNNIENESEILLSELENEIEEKSIISTTYEKSSKFDLILYLETLVNCEKNKQILKKILENQVDYYCTLYKTKNIDTANPIYKIVLKEINDTKNELIKINTYYNQLISLNIIYPKYHNFVAITAFYEYLLSGRCDSLSGSTGAYNLYETELRANIIINKLDIIIEKLDYIKENQYQMYCMLKEINSTQEKMISEFNNTFDNVLTSIGEIAQIETITAYNASKTAQYSQMNNKILNNMKWLLFIK